MDNIQFKIKNLILKKSSDFYVEMPVKSAFLYDITALPAYVTTYILYTYIIYVTIFISVSVLLHIHISKAKFLAE